MDRGGGVCVCVCVCVGGGGGVGGIQISSDRDDPIGAKTKTHIARKIL